MYKQKTHANPRLTYSVLAKLLAPHATHVHVKLIQEAKHPIGAQVISYVDCVRQMAAHLAAANVLPAALEPHEAALLNQLKQQKVSVPKGAYFKLPLPANKYRKWNLAGVDLSFVPDLLVVGPAGTGALKFHCAQDPLPRGVAKAMAGLLFHYLKNELGESTTVPEYCFVYSIRANKLQSAKPISSKLVANATLICQFVATMWPAL